MGCSSLSQNSQVPVPPMSIDRQMAIEEMINAQSSAAQLQILLQDPSKDGLESAYSLAQDTFQAITGALSILNSSDIPDACWKSAVAHHSSPCTGDRKIKNSGDRPKISAAPNQRGCHKRRRTNSSSWTTLSAAPFEDGYLWRKYGQKEILGAKHPRGYFRCTHKIDQGCMATKHVQKSEADPSMYVVTYMGQHTCREVLKAPHLILDSTSREQCVLNFESTMAKKHEHSFLSSLSSIKHESIVEKPIDLNLQASSSPSNYFVSFENDPFDSNLPMEKFSMTLPETGDVASSSVYSSASSHAMDMDLMDSVEFEDVLRFDEPGFL